MLGLPEEIGGKKVGVGRLVGYDGDLSWPGQ
jgi:hypothetical protein